jgi:hypothetical protein
VTRTRFNFVVTAEDIAKATANDSYKCVVATAIARTVKDARKIEVDLQTIRWSDSEGRHVFLTPFSVAGYVIAFDAGEELFPFKFHVRDSVPSVQRRALSPAAKEAKASRGKIRNERRRMERAEAVLADPDAPADKVAEAQEQVKRAPAKVAAAKADHEDLKAAYKAAGQSIADERITETARRAPTLYKGKRRVYGQRALRVNQAEGRKHYA